jgi:DNA gyrase subunit A
VNVLELQDEKVVSLRSIPEFTDNLYVVFATRHGLVKRTRLMAFANVRSNGIIATSFGEGDSLINVRLTDGSQDIILGTRFGQSIRFYEEDVRMMGRTARGVKGIQLREGDEVVSMDTVAQRSEELVLTVCEQGFGKCTVASEYPAKKRGGLGVITIKTSERNGQVVDLRRVRVEDDILLVTDRGKLIRLSVTDISVMSRNTQGVRLVRLGTGEQVVSVTTVTESAKETAEDEDADRGGGDGGGANGGDGSHGDAEGGDAGGGGADGNDAAEPTPSSPPEEPEP